MSKKLFISTLLIICLITISSLAFATNNDDNMMQNGVNSIRNVVGGAENVLEDTVTGAGNAMKNGTNSIENGLNSAVDNMTEGNNNNNQNNDNNTNNYIAGATNNNNDNNGNYTATRTATFMGMNGTTWVWFIIGLVGIAIVALVWAYSSQGNRTSEHEHH